MILHYRGSNFSGDVKKCQNNVNECKFSLSYCLNFDVIIVDKIKILEHFNKKNAIFFTFLYIEFGHFCAFFTFGWANFLHYF